MSRPFAAFDIDGTLIRWQLYHAITDNLVKRGVISGERFETIRGARMAWKKRSPGASFGSYEKEVIKAYEEALSKNTTKQLMTSVEEVFAEYRDKVYIYTRDLIARLKAEDFVLFAISGSQTEVVKLMAAHYGFDDYLGTDYERAGQRFTGNKTFHAAKKDQVLKKMVVKHNATFQGSIAVGDSKGDAAMMRLVEQPIAFNPDADLYQIAKDNAWKIVLERKNMFYELQWRDGHYELVATN